MKAKILVWILTMPFFWVMLFLAAVILLSGCAPSDGMVSGVEQVGYLAGGEKTYIYPCPDNIHKVFTTQKRMAIIDRDSFCRVAQTQ